MPKSSSVSRLGLLKLPGVADMIQINGISKIELEIGCSSNAPGSNSIPWRSTNVYTCILRMLIETCPC
jgi:hypothetical protein